MHEKLSSAKEKAIRIKEKLGINFLYIVGLVPILLIGLYVRTRNLKWLHGKYLLGLDPYCFYRYAGYILEHGKLMAVDTLRYVPLGYKPLPSDIFFSYVLAYSYKLIAWTGLNRMTFHVWYPVIAGLIGFVFFFFFVREIFGNKVAIVSTALLAVIPTYIYRTGAGFADHEALAFVWLFASLLLFVKAWKSERLLRYISLAVGSGIIAGLMVLTWGGYKFLLVTISAFMILMLLFSKLEERHLLIYASWLATIALFLYLRLGINFVKAYEFLLLVFAGLACLIYFVFTKTDFAKRAENIFSRGSLSITVAALIGFITVIATGIINLGSLYTSLLHPTGASRLAFTVSENAQPYFIGQGGWLASFGPTIFLLLVGAVVLFYLIFKGKRKYAGWLTFGWTLVLITFVFGKYKAGAWINKLFSSIYLYILAAFVLALLGTYFYTYAKNKGVFDKLFNADWQLLLIFGWFIFSIIIARGSVRTIMALAPVAAIVSGFFIVKTVEWCWTENRKVYAILLGLFVIFCFVANAQAGHDKNLSSGSGYPGQWESAMGWIKESTRDDAVFAHWWDYGYWTQAMGERASIVDGGNVMGWDHQMGRYGLLGREPEKYLPYLKTHETTHLLISREEIGKFSAFSTIGSDEDWDLQSTIGIFSVQQQKELRQEDGQIKYELTYGGAWPLDKDYILGSKVLAQGSSYIIGFTLERTGDVLINPHVLFYDGTDRYATPLKCICNSGVCQTINPDGFGGCLILVPYYTSDTEVNPIGAGFFVSEKVEDTTLVKLYLKNEQIDYFKDVYNDGMPLGIYNGNIIGPTRIWELSYPKWVQANDIYLESSPYG